MTQSTSTYTAFPNHLFDDLIQGKIDNMMFNVLVWLYRRANWKNGIAVRASSQQIRAELWGGWTYEKNPPSERTIQEKLRRLVEMGYIVSHHMAGRRGTYSISINNYPALTPAGEEIILRPTETKSLDEVLAASCGDDDGESSAESSCDPAVSLPRTHSTTLSSFDYHPPLEVSEQVSEPACSLRSQASQSGEPAGSDRLASSGDVELDAKVWQWLWALPFKRNKLNQMFPDAVRAFKACAQAFDQPNPVEVWLWNQKHKGGKYKFRSLAQFAKACESDSENSVLVQFKAHEPNACKICCPKGGSPEHKFEDVVRKHGSDTLCSECGKVHNSKKPCKPTPSSAGPLTDEGRQAFEIEEDIS